MSFAQRTTTFPSHIRPSSGLSTRNNATNQTSALQSRINEKRVELENLRQLRDLSGGLAEQMQQLEDKLATLNDGTEAVAAVLSNWNSVLRAIQMASAKLPVPDETDEETVRDPSPSLPQTLVRIPVEQAEAVQRHGDGRPSDTV